MRKHFHGPIKVCIGIQARSTSVRFPNKAQAMIGDRTMMEMVIEAVNNAIQFLSRERETMEFFPVLLIPKGDYLKRYSGQIAVIEGDENNEMNVLSRYRKAHAAYRPDFMVRITGDCPLVPDFVISKHIRSAVYGAMDYVTNADPRFRTAPDGYDVEVMSKKMMVWLFANATSNHDLEHVTTLIKSSPDLPTSMRIGHIIDHLDHSDLKISVDTPDDLERVRMHYGKVEAKLKLAHSYRPNTTVYRL